MNKTRETIYDILFDCTTEELKQLEEKTGRCPEQLKMAMLLIQIGVSKRLADKLLGEETDE